MMKNKKGFTLIELLAVIAILGIIISIATTSVIKGMNDSKEKTKYLAAKEITEIAAVYLDTDDFKCKPSLTLKNKCDCVSVLELIYDEYLDKDATNPRTGDNGSFVRNDKICKSEDSVIQDNYKIKDDTYNFDGYKYVISTDPITDDQYYLLGDVNMDGKITEEDRDLICDHFGFFSTEKKELSDFQQKLGDADGNGYFALNDCVEINNKLNNK